LDGGRLLGALGDGAEHDDGGLDQGAGGVDAPAVQLAEGETDDDARSVDAIWRRDSGRAGLVSQAEVRQPVRQTSLDVAPRT
jgi:hypothetical protein